MQALLKESPHPRTRCDFEIMAIVGEHRGVAVQFGLEDPHDRFGHGVINTVADRADGRAHADFVDAVGVGHGCAWTPAAVAMRDRATDHISKAHGVVERFEPELGAHVIS